jgi:hypothetical protein
MVETHHHARDSFRRSPGTLSCQTGTIDWIDRMRMSVLKKARRQWGEWTVETRELCHRKLLQQSYVGYDIEYQNVA